LEARRKSAVATELFLQAGREFAALGETRLVVAKALGLPGATDTQAYFAAVGEQVEVAEYAPRAIKLATVGFGGADKMQVAHMMRAVLKVEGQLSADAADALAVAIRRGLDDKVLREKIGLAGRQRVAERWSWRHCAQQTVDQYREVLSMPHNIAKLAKRDGK
jgi:glycosyltransferase involved in cell wall biosynthesis